MQKFFTRTLVAAAVSAAAMPAMADVNSELAALKQRISQLEAQQATAPKWDSRVQLSGEFDFLATASQDKAGNTTSDLDLDSAKIKLKAALSDQVDVAVKLSGEAFKVDDAVVNIHSADKSLTFTGGKTDAPFAVVTSESWTSPLTDDFVDHNDTLAQLSWQQGVFNADVYAFNAGGDTIENLGLNLGAEVEGLSVGAGFINNIRNTESYEDAADIKDGSGKLEAVRVNAAYTLGALTVSAEYMASGKVAERDNKRLSVWDLSADYSTQLLGAASLISFSHSQTENAKDIFAESRTAIGINREVSEYVNVAAEYVRDNEYDDSYTDTANLVLMTHF